MEGFDYILPLQDRKILLIKMFDNTEDNPFIQQDETFLGEALLYSCTIEMLGKTYIHTGIKDAVKFDYLSDKQNNNLL